MRRFSTKEYESALLSKGFLLERQRKDKIYYLYAEGKKQPIFTKISHGSSETMGPKLCSMCKKQLRLNSNQEFDDFVECPLTGDSYVLLLREKGHI